MKLLNKKTGKPVAVGDTVISFRGEAATVTGWAEPHTSCSTGRIYVMETGASAERAYYPAVYDCKFVEESHANVQ